MTSFNILKTITLGVLITPSVLLCQVSDSLNLKKNRISLQTGLFHYFFDNAPILNLNYLDSESSLQKPFKGLLLNSIGIQYNRKINTRSAFSFEVMSFFNSYKKHSAVPTDFLSLEEPLVFSRRFTTININFSQSNNIAHKLHFIYGAGINYRHGVESILINILLHPNWNEFIIRSTIKNDLGLSTFFGIEYTPLEWLTLYTKIDFIGFIYLNDKKNIEHLKSYTNMPGHYPSRFDLSLRFGIGFNF